MVMEPGDWIIFVGVVLMCIFALACLADIAWDWLHQDALISERIKRYIHPNY